MTAPIPHVRMMENVQMESIHSHAHVSQDMKVTHANKVLIVNLSHLFAFNFYQDIHRIFRLKISGIIGHLPSRCLNV